MRADELIHSVRDSVPDALERGAGISNQLRAELYVSGVLTAPDSGTATVFQPDGQQVATGAVTVTDSVATFSVSISDTALLGDQYRVEWALTVGAETYRHRTRAEVVRKRLVCPISVVDLFSSRHSWTQTPQTACQGSACQTTQTSSLKPGSGHKCRYALLGAGLT